MEMSARSEAIVLSVSPGLKLRVGGLSLAERWERSLSAHGAGPIRRLSLDEATAALESAQQPQLLVWGDAVIEHLALEDFVEQAPSCPSNGARTLAIAGGAGPLPVLCLGPEAARRLASAGAGALDSIDQAVAALSAGGIAIEPRTIAEGYGAIIHDADEAKRATFRLLERLRWRPGGLVAKYLNRPISLRLSYLLVDTRVTPNQTTLFAFVVGAVGVVLIFMGGYSNVVWGTVLLQINSIVDGIDGELARVRHQSSEFGAYLDSVCDEILSSSTMIGIGYELARRAEGPSPYLWLGLVAGVMNFAYALVHWHCKHRHGLGFYWWFEAYKPRRQVQRSTSAWSYLKKLSMKESYLFLFMVAAIFGFLQVILWPLAVGGLALIVLFFIHIVIKRARF